MSGDHEGNRKYRYTCECSKCGAMLSTLSVSGSRKPGRFVRCSTEWEDQDEECGRVNWATEPPPDGERPRRWQGRRKPAEPPEMEGSA